MNKIFFVVVLVTLVIAVFLADSARRNAAESPSEWRFEASPAGDLITISPPPGQAHIPDLAALVTVHLLPTLRPQNPASGPPSSDDLGPKIWGAGSVSGNHVLFRPSASLTPGQSYFVGIRRTDGPLLASAVLSIPATVESAPQVSIHPADSLPANALKLYLQFSRPMEQGVMLKNLRLTDASGEEVSGAFRETELWSPDGRRLTVWFHPGRQKTAVQLGIDEGPVLTAGHHYKLIIDGHWRDTTGQPLGVAFEHAFSVIDADHRCPDPSTWEIAADPRSITVTFDESLDQAMLPRSLSLQGPATETKPITAQCLPAPDGCSATLNPNAPLLAGTYTLRIDPLLEDLAGNNLEHPFEVDLSQPVNQTRPILERRFEISD